MEAKIRETAEKIYVEQIQLTNLEPVCDEAHKALVATAKKCIDIAKVFHAVCNDDVMKVEK